MSVACRAPVEVVKKGAFVFVAPFRVFGSTRKSPQNRRRYDPRCQAFAWSNAGNSGLEVRLGNSLDVRRCEDYRIENENRFNIPKSSTNQDVGSYGHGHGPAQPEVGSVRPAGREGLGFRGLGLGFR